MDLIWEWTWNIDARSFGEEGNIFFACYCFFGVLRVLFLKNKQEMFIREGTCIRIKYVILSIKSTIISLHKINSILALISFNQCFLFV